MNKQIELLKNSKLDGELKLVNYGRKAINSVNSDNNLKNKLLYPKMVLNLTKGVISEFYEINARRKYMAKVFECNINNVAGDIDDLKQLKDNTYLFATDFDYSAILKDEWLKNITVIWGNANLYALDDLNKLESLKYVTGKIYYKNEIYTFEELQQEFGNLSNSKEKVKK